MHTHPASSSAVRLSLPGPLTRPRAGCRALGAAVLALGLLTAPLHGEAAPAVYHSDLWGAHGEAWSPSSRLPDFSFAGYHAGNQPLPTVPVQTNVKDFGATGDGRTDDTAAFQQAIAATTHGALYIPAGRYKITDVLQITKPYVVLRGAGEGKTTLLLSRSLKELTGQAPYGKAALITVRGSQRGQQLTTVVAAAKRGERQLRLASTAGITAGQWIRLRMQNPASNSLGCYLYANQGCVNAERQPLYGRQYVDWVVQVQAVQGQTITLVRPLRLEVRLEWAPRIWQHRPTVQEVGIEHLTLAFPNVQYGGHNHWAGYYAIYFEQVYHSWVRHVTITDADRGIEFRVGGHNTVTHVTLNTHWRTHLPNPIGGQTTGHYGFDLHALTQDNLIQESELQTRFDHNMSVGAFANGNVFSGILSVSGGLDHHGAAPYENLFTEIVLTGTATNLLASGGNRADEPNAGARTTLWNVVSLRGPFGLYTPARFPQMHLIGLDQWVTTRTPTGPWIERWPGALTSPVNLYEAQVQYRRGGTLPVEPTDTDGDGLSDTQERTVYHTDPTRVDTDGDGLTDGPEAAMWGAAWAADADRDGLANLLDADADDDGERDGVEQQHGTDPASPAAGPVYRWLEAEAATTRTTPMTVATDPGASGGQYLWVPEGQGNRWSPTVPGGEARYRFTVPVGGTYVVWGRVRTQGGTGDSFFVALDTGTPLLWGTRAGGRNVWGWDRVHGSGPALTRFALTAGPHTLRILQREDGTQLDRLLITNDLQFVPR